MYRDNTFDLKEISDICKLSDIIDLDKVFKRYIAVDFKKMSITDYSTWVYMWKLDYENLSLLISLTDRKESERHILTKWANFLLNARTYGKTIYNMGFIK